jgi:hypothetical protein
MYIPDSFLPIVNAKPLIKSQAHASVCLPFATAFHLIFLIIFIFYTFLTPEKSRDAFPLIVVNSPEFQCK